MIKLDNKIKLDSIIYMRDDKYGWTCYLVGGQKIIFEDCRGKEIYDAWIAFCKERMISLI